MEHAFLGVLLAFVAGTLNTFTFLNAGILSTVQSGNVLFSFLGFASGDWQRGLMVLMSIAAFFVGTVAASVVMARLVRLKRAYSPWVLLTEVVLLMIAACLWGFRVVPGTELGAHLAFIPIGMAAGIQGAAFHKIDGRTYANIAITTVIQGAGSFVAEGLIAKNRSARKLYLASASRFALVVVGFGCGGLAAIAIAWLVGTPAATLSGNPTPASALILILPILVLGTAAAVSWRSATVGRNPDPA